MKTQTEVNHFLQDHNIKDPETLLSISYKLREENLFLPNNVIVNSAGIDFKTFLIWFKIEYPKTVKECCKILGAKIDIEIKGYEGELLTNIQKLLICRDAYWKLHNGWEPAHTNDSSMYSIVSMKDNLQFIESIWTQHLLEFPNKEVRNIFYNNFKDLIEECKPLI